MKKKKCMQDFIDLGKENDYGRNYSNDLEVIFIPYELNKARARAKKALALLFCLFAISEKNNAYIEEHISK